MSSKNDTKASAVSGIAEAPVEPRICEALPSRENGISALASANAPFIFFDSVAFLGQSDGVASITLTALRGIAAEDGQISSDRVITAHLRSSVAALGRLRGAIDGVIKMVEQQQAEQAAIGEQMPTIQ